MRVRVRMRVGVDARDAAFFVRVRVAVRFRRDDLDAAVLHAACGEQAFRGALQVVGLAAEDDDLEAVVVIEVDVERGAHLLAERVLELGEALGEIADVMVVDDGERGDGIDRVTHLRLAHLAANEVSEQLGARPSPLLDQGVEREEKRRVHRDAEADQILFHHQASYRLSANAIHPRRRCVSGAEDGRHRAGRTQRVESSLPLASPTDFVWRDFEAEKYAHHEEYDVESRPLDVSPASPSIPRSVRSSA